MSMSALSSQLASINSSSQRTTAAGSILPTSRRPEDAIGRGIRHSVRHGYALSTTSAKHKPSVLHTDSRAGADVPLSTLRENCIASFRQLYFQTRNNAFVSYEQTLAEPHTLERGLNTRAVNDKIDQKIGNLLILLGTVLGDSSGAKEGTTSSASVLHILEYLLRRYDIHARVQTAECLILAFLPHHESVLFSKVLQLVDLVALSHFSFLRPHAAVGATSVSRNTIAKWTARDDALVTRFCQMGKDAASVHSNYILHMCHENAETSPVAVFLNTPPRRGVSLVVSFSAAVLIEALAIQVTDTKNSGTVSESTLRCILPFVLEAVGPGNKETSDDDDEFKLSLGLLCPDWRSFGYVITSTLAEHCVLAPDVTEVLAATIVKGALETETILSQENSSFENDEGGTLYKSTALSLLVIESCADSILAVMSLLLTGNKRGVNTMTSPSSFPPFVVSLLKVGCDLPSSAYRALAKSQALPAALGYLLEEREIDIQPFLLSLLAKSIARLLPEEGKTSDKKLKKRTLIQASSAQLILNMLNEDSLKLAWTVECNSLSAFVASLVVSNFVSYDTGFNDNDNDDTFLSYCRTILDAVRVVDVKGHDTGVGYAVTFLISGADKKRVVRRLTLLMRTNNKALLHSKECNGSDLLEEKIDSVDNGQEDIGLKDIGRLLPARVALEQPDPAVRIDAIRRLLDEVIADASAVDDLSVDDDDFAFDSATKMNDLGFAFLHRCVSDDNAKVAISSANALKTLSNVLVSKRFFSNPKFSEGILSAFQKWTMARIDTPSGEESQKSKKKSKKKKDKDKKENELETLDPSQHVTISHDRLQARCSILDLAGLAAKVLLERSSLEDNDETDTLTSLESKQTALEILIQTIASHMDKDVAGIWEPAPSDEIVNTAALSLINALSVEQDERRSNNELAKDLLATNPVCITTLRKCIASYSVLNDGETDFSHLMSWRFLWLCLASLSDNFARKNEVCNSLVLDTTICILGSYQQVASSSEICAMESAILLKSLELFFSYLHMRGVDAIANLITRLASVKSLEAYTSVSKPSICLLLKVTANDSSPIIFLLEAISRPHLTHVTSARLFVILKDCVSEATNHEDTVSYAIIPVLALLSHPARDVREQALNLLSQLSSIDKRREDQTDVTTGLLTVANNLTSSMRSSFLMDGASLLPELLFNAVTSSGDTQTTRRELFKNCVLTMNALSGSAKNGSSFLTDAPGFCEAVLIVLQAMESAGESAFPLSERWECVGRELFSLILDIEGYSPLSQSAKGLLENVVLMLKGVCVKGTVQHASNYTNVIITTGPNGAGGRSRSYSVGASDDVYYIDPYPEKMQSAISSCLTSAISKGRSQCVESLCCDICQFVLGRSSWANCVFPKLNSGARRNIAAGLLALRCEGNYEVAGTALLGLPLEVPDFLFLLSAIGPMTETTSSANLLSLTVLSDCIRGRAHSLSADSGALDLSSKLFDQLSVLSRTRPVENATGPLLLEYNGSEYTRFAILQSLLALHASTIDVPQIETMVPVSKRGGRRRSSSDAGNYGAKNLAAMLSERSSLLVSLTGGSNEGSSEAFNPLPSGKGKATAFSLLTCLCSRSPSAVVGSLLPALVSVITTTRVSNESVAVESPNHARKAARDALMVVIPAYCSHAGSGGFCLFDLLSSFIDGCSEDVGISEELQIELYTYVLGGLLTVTKESCGGHAVASVVASFLSAEAYKRCVSTGDINAGDTTIGTEKMADPVAFAMKLVQGVQISDQVATLLQLLRYVGDLIATIANEGSLASMPANAVDSDFMAVSTSDLREMACYGPVVGRKRYQSTSKDTWSSQQKLSLMWLVKNVLIAVQNLLITPQLKKRISKSDGPLADICLGMWQELMQIHANSLLFQSEARKKSSKETGFWHATCASISECLATVQRLLPTPHFLASISSLIKDDEVDLSLRKKAIIVLSQRASETNSVAPEAALFLEMIPDVVEVVNAPSPNKDTVDSVTIRRFAAIQQAALVAIEELARTLVLGVSDEKMKRSRAVIFMPALKAVAGVLNSSASVLDVRFDERSKSDHDASIDAEILSSAALCISTLVRILKAQSLPLLPNLATVLISSLSSVHTWMKNKSLLKRDEPQFQSLKLLQLSVLRAIVAVAETLPQFLVPYLSLALSPTALPSRLIRETTDDDAAAVNEMAIRFDRALATGSPPRQLIPALNTAIALCLDQQNTNDDTWKEALALLSMMKASVQNSTRADLSPVMGKVVSILLEAYGYQGNIVVRSELLQAANEALLSLVMKLSEAQLRPLYAKFREWRGELDITGRNESQCCRHYAFWSLSAALGNELKSIFLPCMGSVVADAVIELDFAVASMCISSKSSSGNKKRRKVEDSFLFDPSMFSPLQPLLRCLEVSLKADAHDGGNWVRSDEGQRFNTILSPLGKLLQAKVPADLPLVALLGSNKTASAFEKLVQGVGTVDHGSVIGCLTALAAAAGNEQLWKPLNHALLQACGNKNRSEVRKAGVQGLLSIIQTLGEEYMVLLPECLPILSELLEDEDEEIAALSKECVRLGEELLGESLDDSFR